MGGQEARDIVYIDVWRRCSDFLTITRERAIEDGSLGEMKASEGRRRSVSCSGTFETTRTHTVAPGLPVERDLALDKRGGVEARAVLAGLEGVLDDKGT